MEAYVIVAVISFLAGVCTCLAVQKLQKKQAAAKKKQAQLAERRERLNKFEREMQDQPPFKKLTAEWWKEKVTDDRDNL